MGDKETKKSGSLLEDFDPPVNPPKQIDDPTDEKPEDWVDEAKIEDPEASKPEDWDEEDDGEWEAPLVDNPACAAAGCGEWSPAMIENPDYIGEWKPKQIDNPAFFETENPFVELDSIAGVAIDIWTMQRGIEYDNVYVGVSEDAAYELAANWEIRSKYQKAAMGTNDSKSGGASDMLSTVKEFVEENTIAVGVTALLILLASYFMCCGSSNDLPAPPAQEEAEEAAEESEDDAKEKPKNKADPTKEKTDG